jgi:hypothetical protein
MRKVETFSPLIIAFMAFTATSDKQYRVYRAPDDFITVEANTASEAIAASGIEKPYKLFHIIPNLGTVLTESQLKVVTPVIEESEPAEKPQAELQAEAPTQVAEITAETAHETSSETTSE